jgi:hypothetical protein
MDLVMSKALLISSLLLMSFISCNKQEKEPEQDISAIVGDKWDGKNRTLNSDEVETARMFCRALEYQNDIIQRMVGVSKKYTFLRNRRECFSTVQGLNDLTVSLTAPTDLGAIPRYQVLGANDGYFVEQVLTHEHTYLKNICASIFSNNHGLKVVEDHDQYKVKYRFLAPNTLEIAVYGQNSRGEWEGLRFEKALIETNRASYRYGMTVARYSGAFCKNGNGTLSYIYQALK